MRHLSIVLLLFAAARATAETTKKPPQKPKEVVELEALEIKVRLQEPTLMYILEQPSFDFEPPSFEPDFLRRLPEPIEENAL